MKKLINNIKNTIRNMQVSVSTYYKFKICIEIAIALIRLFI